MVKNGEQAVGNKTRVKVVKNKVAPPFRECEFEITYGTARLCGSSGRRDNSSETVAPA